MADPGSQRNAGTGAGAVGLAAAAIALMLVAVAVTGFLTGKNARSSSTVTVTATGAPAQSAGSTSVTPAVAAGAHDFVQFACGQCHGFRGKGGVSPDVPALAGLGTSITVAQLTHIINHGLGESANPTKPYMPVWHGIISTRQVGELVAYIRAGLPTVPAAAPVSVPTDQGPAVEGAELYIREGCINCHGPNGLGGVPNPQSEDRTIPPLSGAAFRGEFNTSAKIKAVIRSGSVIGRAPIVSMPHWGGILTPAQLDALVAYLHTLR
jgi:mono/diheme cytochrome c family protein